MLVFVEPVTEFLSYFVVFLHCLVQELFYVKFATE